MKCCPVLTRYQRVPGLVVKGAAPTLVGLLFDLAQLFSRSGLKAWFIVVEYAEGFSPHAHTHRHGRTYKSSQKLMFDGKVCALQCTRIHIR